MADSETFPFPDYKGMTMTVHDACPTRKKAHVHEAIRKLLDKMNIRVVEAERSGTKAVCCGDSFHGIISPEKVLEQMTGRAEEMPCDNVVVYCTSCIKAMINGGKKPRYLVDLLFGLDTEGQETDPTKWHAALDAYIEEH